MLLMPPLLTYVKRHVIIQIMKSLDLSAILTSEMFEPAYIVEGFLYQGQMITIAGEPGVGKSFLMYNLAMCIATGKEFLGMKTTQGSVLYFDEENAGPDLTQYLRWIWTGLDKPVIESLQKSLFIEHFQLTKEGKQRYRYMAKVAVEAKPLLIIVDTATTACGIEDENDNAEASRAIAGLRTAKSAAGLSSSMIIIKHTRTTDEEHKTRTIRGAKIWLGALDGVIYHSFPPGQPRKDGLRNSRLIPDKVRAFGLKEAIKITPKWHENGILLSVRKD